MCLKNIHNWNIFLFDCFSRKSVPSLWLGLWQSGFPVFQAVTQHLLLKPNSLFLKETYYSQFYLALWILVWFNMLWSDFIWIKLMTSLFNYIFPTLIKIWAVNRAVLSVLSPHLAEEQNICWLLFLVLSS